MGIGPRTAVFSLLDGDPATNDIMDGVDTTWSRVPGGAEIGKQADEIIAQFDTKQSGRERGGVARAAGKSGGAAGQTAGGRETKAAR